ncbi:hypothetical protein VTO42DRAFT_2125 [Malbranchea cinnamomea]
MPAKYCHNRESVQDGQYLVQYIFQELATGGDLLSFVNRRTEKFLSEDEAAGIIRQILLGLQYLHDNNIVHRDIKPHNILLTTLAANTRVFITDFGCARWVSPTNPRMRTITGTHEYNAP